MTGTVFTYHSLLCVTIRSGVPMLAILVLPCRQQACATNISSGNYLQRTTRYPENGTTETATGRMINSWNLKPDRGHRYLAEHLLDEQVIADNKVSGDEPER